MREETGGEGLARRSVEVSGQRVGTGSPPKRRAQFAGNRLRAAAGAQERQGKIKAMKEKKCKEEKMEERINPSTRVYDTW